MSAPVKKSHKQLILTLLLIFIVMPAIIFYFSAFQHAHAKSQNIKIDGVYLPAPKEINDFHLTDNSGKPFSKTNLKGHWTMMFFGFTNCAMVCPASLVALNEMYQKLQHQLPDNQLPQVVMVSVDPDRDSVKKMNSYVHAFNPNFIGARANIEETVMLEKQLHIAAAKIQIDTEGKDHYTIDHTAEILVFNPNGQLQAYLSYPHKADQMAQDYKSIIMVS